MGSDADIAIWDPERETEVTHEMLHDDVGYTPYEGRKLKGWPVTVVRRGEVIVSDGELHAERGSGAFLPCDKPDPAKPLEQAVPEMDTALNFGARFGR